MDLLPENLQAFLQHPTVSFLTSTTKDQLTSHLSHLRAAYVQPYIITPLSTFLTSTSTAAMPDLVSVLILIAILFISLKILDYARRVVMFWVGLAFKLIFWGFIIGLGWYAYRFGVESTGRDLGWLWGIVMGFVEDFQARSANPGIGSGSGSGWGSGSGSGAGYGGKKRYGGR